jgi:hypothetical protein
MMSMCIIEIRCSCQRYKSSEGCATMLLWQTNMDGNNRNYEGLCPIFLTEFKQIWDFMKGFIFVKVTDHQIS